MWRALDECAGVGEGAKVMVDLDVDVDWGWCGFDAGGVVAVLVGGDV